MLDSSRIVCCFDRLQRHGFVRVRPYCFVLFRLYCLVILWLRCPTWLWSYSLIWLWPFSLVQSRSFHHCCPGRFWSYHHSSSLQRLWRWSRIIFRHSWSFDFACASSFDLLMHWLWSHRCFCSRSLTFICHGRFSFDHASFCHFRR